MTDNSFINISGWMVNRLGLKGNKLIIYALIYGFSQDGKTEFSGSISYMMKWINSSSKSTVVDALKSLTEEGLIIRNEIYINNVKYVRYRANLDMIYGTENTPGVVQKMHEGGTETVPGVVQKMHEGGTETVPNNTINNTINNNSYIDSNKNIDNFRVMVREMDINEDVYSALEEWMNYKDSKTPKKNHHYTEIGLRKLIKQVIDLSKKKGNDYIVNSIDLAIMNNYTGFIFRDRDTASSKKKDNEYHADPRMKMY